MKRPLRAVLLVLALSATVPTGPLAAQPSPAAGDGVAAFAPPSMGAATLRLLGALAVVGLAMAGSLGGYRWLMRHRVAALAGGERRFGRLDWFSRWVPGGDAADRPLVMSRTYLGAKESLCVVEVGRERFLIGATATRISLLGRLERPPASDAVPDEEPADEPAGQPVEPRAKDFARALEAAGGVVVPMTRPAPAPVPVGAPVPEAESEIRAAIARSRDRLARLTQLSTIGAGRA